MSFFGVACGGVDEDAAEGAGDGGAAAFEFCDSVEGAAEDKEGGDGCGDCACEEGDLYTVVRGFAEGDSDERGDCGDGEADEDDGEDIEEGEFFGTRFGAVLVLEEVHCLSG